MIVRNGQRLGSILHRVEPGRTPEPEPAPAVPDPEREPVDELDRLREQAAALGVKVDRRWGVHRLRQEIESAKEEDDGGDGAHA